MRPDVPLAKYMGSLKVSKRRVQIVVRERLSGRSHFRVDCRPQQRVHDGPGLCRLRRPRELGRS